MMSLAAKAGVAGHGAKLLMNLSPKRVELIDDQSCWPTRLRVMGKDAQIGCCWDKNNSHIVDLLAHLVILSARL